MVWEIKNRSATEPTGVGLDEALRAMIKAKAGQYPRAQAALLPALRMAQDKLGHLSDQVVAEVAGLLGLSAAQALDTADFYEMFFRRPRGRHVIWVCESLSCELCGCEGLLQALEARLGITAGQTTADGRFTLMRAQCLGLCDVAPALMVDDRVYPTVKLAELETILAAAE
jgi:NADH-quinone oxidoreductase subunit E